MERHLMTVDQALDEMDRVQGQLAWHRNHPFLIRPEVIDLLLDRRDAAQAVLDNQPAPRR